MIRKIITKWQQIIIYYEIKKLAKIQANFVIKNITMIIIKKGLQNTNK